MDISFLNQAQVHQVQYGVFDTASHDSYAVSSGSSLIEPNPTSLFDAFASVNRNIGLSSRHSQSSFQYNDPNFLLIRGIARDGSVARISAKPDSPFARAARIFALIPEVGNPVWQLLIGEGSVHESLAFCSSPFSWFPRQPFSPFWYISGSMSFAAPGQVAQRVERHPMMIVDTAATDGVLLSQSMMDHVVSVIESFGPRRVPSSVYPRFENCAFVFRDVAQYISLRIQVGGLGSPIIVSFKLSDYLRFDETGCDLMWKVALVRGWGDVILGPEFLSKFVTVFDTTAHRVGFCSRNSDLEFY